MAPKLRQIIGLAVRIAASRASGLPTDGTAPGWPGFREEEWTRLSKAGSQPGSADAIFVEALARHAYEVRVGRGRTGESVARNARLAGTLT
ncbi:hypothetical protein OJF2_13950 [Aquisphaera giovannonii]|uniref:Uncharacterized protein n=1 Tax=Aquisphaera giovannonii TaxID=406548 RepID=A0A5B9VZ22_9BACT|nr:hypothetical protein [Aquisphaera giovannonii]QEH32910.1 hypothetical protein OJF2_13950 [Aquisphaera giovannonii]